VIPIQNKKERRLVLLSFSYPKKKKRRCYAAPLSKAKLLSVIDGVHVLDQLQNLVAVADLVSWKQVPINQARYVQNTDLVQFGGS